MTIQSQDDINRAFGEGRTAQMQWGKSINPAHTATAGFHLMNGLLGTPQQQSFQSPADLVQIHCTELGGDGLATPTFPGPWHGGVVGPASKKHLTYMGANIIAAAGAPWQVQLVDLCAYYRLSGANVTGTGSRVFINSNTTTFSSSSGLLGTYTNDFANYSRVRFTNSGGALPTGLTAGTDYWTVRASGTTARFATSLANAIAGTTIAFTDAGTGTHTMTLQNPRYTGGVGCQAMIVAQTAPTGGGPTISASSYTNPDGATGRAFLAGTTLNAAADAYATRILHSGNAAGRYGAFIPRQGADRGIASIENLTLSGGTAYTGTGVLALCIVKPIGEPLLIGASGLYSDRDLVNQVPSLPEVPDGACLSWLVYATGATTANSPFTGNATAIWG